VTGVLSPVNGQTPQLHYKGDKSPVNLNYTYSPSLFTSSMPDIVTAGGLFNPVVLNEIILPNGKKYVFNYNVYGEIDKVTLPTGGYYRYKYAAIPGLDGNMVTAPYGQGNRGVIEQYVCESGACQPSEEKKWEYSVDIGSGGSSPYIVTSKAPDQTRTDRYLHKSLNSPASGYDDPLSGRAYDERSYTAASVLLRRSLTKWETAVPPSGTGLTFACNPRITKQVEILNDTSGDKPTKTTTMAYDADVNRTLATFRDWVSVSASTAETATIDSFPLGTALKTEETIFLVNDPNWAAAATNYRNRNLVALPTETKVKDGSGTVVAATKLIYDETGYASLAYGGTVSGWTSPGALVRGMATTTQQWLNYDGTNWSVWPNGSWITTHTQYDQCGSVRYQWDAKGSQSEIIYTDSFSGGTATTPTWAYPTQTKAPMVSGTQLTTSTIYDYQTGKPTSATDANAYASTTEYNDTLNRVTKVVRGANLSDSSPAKGRTEISYDDTNRKITATSSKDNYNTLALKTEGVFDGLGRASEKRAYESATAYSTVKTTYDDLGRVSQVSSPYRAGETVYWTTTTYDALSRVIQVQTPDGSKAQTVYDGARTLGSDPAVKQRLSESDALGRLRTVWEITAADTATESVTFPNQSFTAGYKTTYAYSALDDLTTVTQRVGAGGTTQTRNFVYDSLKRLVSAANPESGTTTYQYDNNGNLWKKKDVRPITTTFSYDALNRVISKTYSTTSTDQSVINAVNATPTVSYYYDNQTLPAGAPSGSVFNRGFALGRQVAVTYGGASAGGYFGYDEAGRAVQKVQQISGNNYKVSAGYNSAGAMTGETYPSLHTVSYGFDYAGRLTGFSGNLGDGVSRTYSTITQFSAAGQVERETYGTQTPLYLKLHYNQRQQMVDLRLGSVNDEWNWNRGALIFYYGTQAVQNWNPFQDDTDNSGNVRRTVNYVPTGVDGSGNVTTYIIPQLDDYTYDALNRVQSVAEAQMNQSGAWSFNVVTQTFGYDRFGNRKITAASGGVNSYNPTYDLTNNRISGMTYDAAGNITSDPATGAGAMTYDAENRMLTASGSSGGGSYVYDGEGRRIKRITGGQEWWYIYGLGGELLAEYLSTQPGVVNKENGYRNGQMLIVGGCDVARWVVTDQLGSPRIEADVTGSLGGIKRHDYLPFGEELFAGLRSGNGYGADCVRQHFGAKERDNETGLDFFGLRYYGSTMGRFTGIDPLLASGQVEDPRSWNRYAYAFNNPLRYIDPFGPYNWDASTESDLADMAP
jgi:RHS repeat-associated protein